MKKIININFQGRVIPIEESAYDTLKQYVESLRKYFANEDGRDEIINDIESRIAELFSERLKRGTPCIADEDINAVIASIGRPQDFDAETGDTAPEVKANAGAGYGGQSYGNTQTNYNQGSSNSYGPNYGRRGRLYRNTDDKIVGGVCSGLANYLGIDPVVVRILFVVLITVGVTLPIYVLLWIIVPSQSLQTNITKRLYRHPDDKVISGVCGGLAAYFNIDAWIPRLIFALPFILALVSGVFNAVWWNWDLGFGPRIVTGSLTGTLFVSYLILWISVPIASTASEMLEMRGERVDLNSIRDTVKGNLETFKTKAEKWSQEVKETARDFSQRTGQHARGFAAEAGPVARRAGSGIGHVIGVLFKAFFMIIAGCIAIALFVLLMALIFGGMAAFPLKNFVLDSPLQNTLAWGTLVFFLGVPLIGLITWLVRRIMGVRSKNKYLGYIFGGLWVLGWFCLIFFLGSFSRDFSITMPVEDKLQVSNPAHGKLYVDVTPLHLSYYHGDWFGFNFDDDMPVYGENMDTLMLNDVRVRLMKSKDSNYHILRVKLAKGRTADMATRTASNINFNIEQQDSVVYFPEGFPISAQDKFRNQQVLMIVQVPVGKRIEFTNDVRHYSWFNINVGRRGRRNWNINDEDWYDDNDRYDWNPKTDYVMTPDGPKDITKLDPVELKNGRYKVIEEKEQDENAEQPERREQPEQPEKKDNKYRYHSAPRADSVTRPTPKKAIDTASPAKKQKQAEAVKTDQAGTYRQTGTETSIADIRLSSPMMILNQMIR